jgi:shikimate dehydrogenase
LRQFGLIGYPLSHSFSQKFFTEKFLQENIVNANYNNFPISSMESSPSKRSKWSSMPVPDDVVEG